ncbi:MAG: type II secretion system protein [Planctomycetes bacterium]|nr:type II secretion system protein [Planctomycetota bacterium]
MATRNSRRGFTLIELLIVVGIISILIVVLFVAILPWLKKSEDKASRTLLQQIGGALSADKVSLSIKKFKKDAGSNLSGRIAADEDLASSQMMLFYAAPTREVWDQSTLYKDRNYAPKLQPQEFTKFTRDEGGKLPYLVDAWETPLKYKYEKIFDGGIIISAGADKMFGNPDDLIYDPRNNTVKTREEMNEK